MLVQNRIPKSLVCLLERWDSNACKPTGNQPTGFTVCSDLNPEPSKSKVWNGEVDIICIAMENEEFSFWLNGFSSVALKSYLNGHFINLGITGPKLNSHGLSPMIGSCARPSFDMYNFTDLQVSDALIRRCFIQSLVNDVLFCGYFRGGGWLVWNWFLITN
jgi:hypothetical protein